MGVAELLQAPSRVDSTRDASANFIWRIGNGEAIESRYVRRGDKAVVYLSTQTACRQACRMCWLTQSGQIAAADIPAAAIIESAAPALSHAATIGGVARLHFDFMARGEPLASRVFLNEAPSLIQGLRDAASTILGDVDTRFIVSTIVPKSLDRPLSQVFGDSAVSVYWSAYSARADVRKRWLPHASEFESGAAAVAEWHRASGIRPRVHHAFITGVNDSPADVELMVAGFQAAGLDPDVNIVRYNPARPGLGTDPGDDRVAELAATYRELIPGTVKVVGRVGYDVYASCGMFPEV